MQNNLYTKFLTKLKENDSFYFILILTILSILFIVPYMIFTGNTDQTYNDIIIEWSSMVSSNKSAEMFLIYFLSFMGIGLCGLHYFFTKQNKTKESTQKTKNKHLPSFILSTVCLISLFQTLIVFDYKNYIFYALLLYVIFLYIKDKNNMLSGIVLFFTNTYAIYAIYRLLAFVGIEVHLGYFAISLISLIVSFSLFVLTNQHSIFNKIILIEQLIIPNLLLLYLQNKYSHLNQITIINTPKPIQLFIWLIIICCLLEAIFLIKKYWDKEQPLNKIISLGTCISIIGFNLYKNVGALVSNDIHHSFENIIGFHQIFQMGQIPFKEYIPVSGMYSVFHGAIFQFFGNGLISQTFATDNILYLMIAISIVFLLKAHTNKITILLISIAFTIIHYDRVIFILPIILLLTIPKITEKPNLWLKIWILTSLFHGLYYPVYGAAVCIGFIPLAICQIYSYFKSNNIKKDIKSIGFWLGWILCFLPVVCSAPLLIGTYKHTKAMGAQTILADGISRFGQIFGDTLMPYLSDDNLFKLVFVYVSTFIIPALFIWVAFALALKILHSDHNEKTNFNNFKNFCMSLCLVIFPLISYTYTMVRLDFKEIYARGAAVFIACIVVLILFAFKYLNTETQKYYIIGFSAFTLALSGFWGFGNNKLKFEPFYSVPDNYLYINNNAYKIGTGWIEKNTYDYIKSFNINKNYKNTFAHGVFGISYIHDLHAISVVEGYTVKGFSAAEETIKLLNENNVNIGQNIDPFYNYYLYHYLITSKKYGWDFESRTFVPNKQFIANNKYTNISYDGFNLGKSPSSLGLSIKTLYPIFTKLQPKTINTKTQKKYQIEFNDKIYGDNLDFIFIEFDNLHYPIKYALYDKFGIHNIDKNHKVAKYFMKKNYNHDIQVKFEWLDDDLQEHFMFADMGKGKLLIPLGAGNRWLLDKHSVINIKLIQNKQEINIPNIKNVEFLKLREVK